MHVKLLCQKMSLNDIKFLSTHSSCISCFRFTKSVQKLILCKVILGICMFLLSYTCLKGFIHVHVVLLKIRSQSIWLPGGTIPVYTMLEIEELNNIGTRSQRYYWFS